MNATRNQIFVLLEGSCMHLFAMLLCDGLIGQQTDAISLHRPQQQQTAASHNAYRRWQFAVSTTAFAIKYYPDIAMRLVLSPTNVAH